MIKEESLIPQPLKILLFDDNLVNQLVGRKLIEKPGYRVDIESNGIGAVNSVQKGLYDLVFMDVQMPEMDGITATRKIRELKGDFSQIPIIAMTANATQEDKKECLQAGMTDFVSKPIIIGKLKESLQAVIDKINDSNRK